LWRIDAPLSGNVLIETRCARMKEPGRPYAPAFCVAMSGLPSKTGAFFGIFVRSRAESLDLPGVQSESDGVGMGSIRVAAA
jgi:hypothetical protein